MSVPKNIHRKIILEYVDIETLQKNMDIFLPILFTPNLYYIGKLLKKLCDIKHNTKIEIKEKKEKLRDFDCGHIVIQKLYFETCIKELKKTLSLIDKICLYLYNNLDKDAYIKYNYTDTKSKQIYLYYYHSRVCSTSKFNKIDNALGFIEHFNSAFDR